MKRHPAFPPDSCRRLVATSALIVTAAAAPGASEAAWRQSEFIVGGIYSGDAFDPQRFLWYQRAGLNRVINGDRDDVVDAQRTSFALDSLRSARRGFDLKLIAAYRKGSDDERIAFNPRAREHRAGLARTLGRAGGINRPAVDGWWVWDEPLTDEDLRAAGDLAALLDSLPETSDQLALISLLPVYASGQPVYDRLHGPDKRAAYERYLGRVAAMYTSRGMRPPLLCADHYPFQDAVVRRDYFLNLAMLRDAAARWGTRAGRVPFWVVVQLSPARRRCGGHRETPTATQVKWQVSNAMAYGAKGILYWTLVPSGRDEFGPGLLDRAGRPTTRYGLIRDFNLEVRRLGQVLMRLDVVSVRHQSAGPHEGIAEEVLGAARTPPSFVRGITGGRGDGLVSHLRDGSTGEDYLFVVNKGLRATADFAIELAADFAAVERVTGATVPPVRVFSRGRRFDARNLAPGCGALYRVRTAAAASEAR